MKRAEITWLVFFLLVFGVLGYYREYFFVNLNKLLFSKYYNRPTEDPVAQSMMFFGQFSYAQLYYSKYLFTLAWAGIFFLANFFALVKLTAGRKPVRILMYSYAVLLGVAVVSMLYGYLVRDSLQGDQYTLSRWLMGVAQSPIICLILLAAEKLLKTSRNPS